MGQDEDGRLGREVQVACNWGMFAFGRGGCWSIAECVWAVLLALSLLHLFLAGLRDTRRALFPRDKEMTLASRAPLPPEAGLFRRTARHAVSLASYDLLGDPELGMLTTARHLVIFITVPILLLKMHCDTRFTLELRQEQGVRIISTVGLLLIGIVWNLFGLVRNLLHALRKNNKSAGTVQTAEEIAGDVRSARRE